MKILQSLGRKLFGESGQPPRAAAEPKDSIGESRTPDPDLTRAATMNRVPIWDRPPGWATDNVEAYMEPLPPMATTIRPLQIVPVVGGIQALGSIGRPPGMLF